LAAMAGPAAMIASHVASKADRMLLPPFGVGTS
jgi:hypothetical protein